MEGNNFVIILIGPPGAGKGTQAELLAEKFGLFHFETSKIIEEKLNNADSNDEVLMEEKRKWTQGELNSPELVVEWIIERIKDFGIQKTGLVFSGSPRTMYEAEREMPVLEEFYGADNLKIIHINLTKEESIKRNSSRRICRANRHPIPNFPTFKDLKSCPKDGSELVTRALDTAETISVRYETYLRRTHPVLSFVESRGHEIIEIEGEQDINNVFEDIVSAIESQNTKNG